jgi:hypothetical protein
VACGHPRHRDLLGRVIGREAYDTLRTATRALVRAQAELASDALREAAEHAAAWAAPAPDPAVERAIAPLRELRRSLRHDGPFLARRAIEGIQVEWRDAPAGLLIRYRTGRPRAWNRPAPISVVVALTEAGARAQCGCGQGTCPHVVAALEEARRVAGV